MPAALPLALIPSLLGLLAVKYYVHMRASERVSELHSAHSIKSISLSLASLPPAAASASATNYVVIPFSKSPSVRVRRPCPCGHNSLRDCPRHATMDS